MDEATHGPLAGFTIGVTAARRADDLIALLRRRGASVVHAPALRIVPLADDGELMAATKELIDCPRTRSSRPPPSASGAGSKPPTDGGSARDCWSGCAPPNCWRAGPR